MDRSNFGLDLSSKNLPAKTKMTDEQVDEKYKEIQSRSGVLTICERQYHAEVKDFIDKGELGRGTFGVVKKAEFQKTKTIMAVKTIAIGGDPEDIKRTVMDMDVIMRSHDCPYIVRCYGCFVFDNEVRICMEFMRMCLGKLLKIVRRFPEPIIGKTTICVLLALQYLKEKEKIMHRDVKPSNILIDNNGSIKLCDFGIAGRLIDSQRALTNSKGCVAYLAPERVGSDQCSYGVRADVWSLGITLIELATGVHPYNDCLNEFDVLAKISKSDPPSLGPSNEFTDDFRAFISKCLIKNHEKRPKFNELLAHKFIQVSEKQNVDVAAWFQNALLE